MAASILATTYQLSAAQRAEVLGEKTSRAIPPAKLALVEQQRQRFIEINGNDGLGELLNP